MKIMAGDYKRKNFNLIKGANLKPTLSRVKKPLFDILNDKIENSIFLDLYSGSGGIGFEALSRGAQKVIMIERDPLHLRGIIKNVNALGLHDCCRAYKNDVFIALEILQKKSEKFDIIFLDPPYLENLCQKTLSKLDGLDILNEDGVIVVEHHEQEILLEQMKNLKLFSMKKYGTTVLSFYFRMVNENE